MKRVLSRKEYITVASMLFGLFFGAGNLIFPVSMGQAAGYNVWQAICGFLITGVGLPLFGIIALGISRCSGLAELSGRIGKKYSTFFTCALYLTIGPFFAIPRCATVPFSIGVEPLIGENISSKAVLAVFSVIFFAIVLWFSLRPNGILTWIGKVLNPVFLVFLGILIVTSLLSPVGSIGDVAPQASYESGAFFNGLLEGYNTMDALAGLAFGIIVVNVIQGLGIKEPGDVAKCTVKAGILSSILMGGIYILVTVIGTQSRGLFELSANGGTTLARISGHYFGAFGAIILAVTVTFACLKTSIGLITSCSETFAGMFPHVLSYRKWAVIFSGVALLIANLGLNTIIRFSLPVLMFLYPLAITLILLGMTGHLFGNARSVYICTTLGAFCVSILDFLNALPDSVRNLLHADRILVFADKYIPLFSEGMGFLVPAIAGFLAAILIRSCRRKH